MDQKKLAQWLRVILTGVVVCSLIVYFVLIPLWGCRIVERNPVLSGCFWPWLVLIWCTAVPLPG